MALVHLSGELRRRAAGKSTVEVDATTVGEVIRELTRRFPDLAPVLDESLNVALDGEVVPNAEFIRVDAGTDIHFVPAIAGG